MTVEHQPKLLYGIEIQIPDSRAEDAWEIIASKHGCYLDTYGNAFSGDKTWILMPIRAVTQRNFQRSKLKVPKGSHQRLQTVCENLKIPYGKPQWHLVVDTF